MHRFNSFIGYEIRGNKGTILGKFTDFEECDGKVWLTIDDSYQVDSCGVSEVIDLTTGKTYLKVK